MRLSRLDRSRLVRLSCDCAIRRLGPSPRTKRRISRIPNRPRKTCESLVRLDFSWVVEKVEAATFASVGCARNLTMISLGTKRPPPVESAIAEATTASVNNTTAVELRKLIASPFRKGYPTPCPHASMDAGTNPHKDIIPQRGGANHAERRGIPSPPRIESVTLYQLITYKQITRGTLGGDVQENTDRSSR